MTTDDRLKAKLKELEFLTDVVERNWFSEGKYTREFEDRLAKISEKAHALAFCNATSALITGMKSRGIGAGDEVIVSAISDFGSAEGILSERLVPVFALLCCFSAGCGSRQNRPHQASVKGVVVQ